MRGSARSRGSSEGLVFRERAGCRGRVASVAGWQPMCQYSTNQCGTARARRQLRDRGQTLDERSHWGGSQSRGGLRGLSRERVGRRLS